MEHASRETQSQTSDRNKEKFTTVTGFEIPKSCYTLAGKETASNDTDVCFVEPDVSPYSLV